MNDELTFTLLKKVDQYGIYYCVPSTQCRLKCGMDRSCMFVMRCDEIVFIPRNYRSQYQAIIQCENFIENEMQNDNE